MLQINTVRTVYVGEHDVHPGEREATNLGRVKMRNRGKSGERATFCLTLTGGSLTTFLGKNLKNVDKCGLTPGACSTVPVEATFVLFCESRLSDKR